MDKETKRNRSWIGSRFFCLLQEPEKLNNEEMCQPMRPTDKVARVGCLEYRGLRATLQTTVEFSHGGARQSRSLGLRVSGSDSLHGGVLKGSFIVVGRRRGWQWCSALDSGGTQASPKTLNTNTFKQQAVQVSPAGVAGAALQPAVAVQAHSHHSCLVNFRIPSLSSRP